MTIRQTLKTTYTKELKMLRVCNGDIDRSGVWEYTKYYIRTTLITTHKNLTAGKPVLSNCTSFTYGNMSKYPVLASAFWKEVAFINSIWSTVHPNHKNGKKKDAPLPIWKMD